jgi:hypothetical protein
VPPPGACTATRLLAVSGNPTRKSNLKLRGIKHEHPPAA